MPLIYLYYVDRIILQFNNHNCLLIMETHYKGKAVMA